MLLIADDPIVRSMERWGYPPWLLARGSDNEEYEEDEEDGI